MAKIGRNERCPCGSGRKYKHCCALNPLARQRPATAEEQLRISLMGAVEEVSRSAEEGRAMLKELGVFVLFATVGGNAWLLEATQSDCVKLVGDGSRLPVPIDENPETIAVEWSHMFSISDRRIQLEAYQDHSRTFLEDCPVKEVSAALRRIKKKVPAEMLKQIHIGTEPA